MVLSDPVEPTHALNPTNDSEGLVSHMGFDTLIRLNCRGGPRPGLAKTWARDPVGRVWTFTLRPDLRQFDRSPMTASEILKVWDGRKAVERSVVIQSAAALNDTTLSITLSQPQDSVPQILADPAFSLAIDPGQRPPGLKLKLLPGGDPRDALDGAADLVVSRDPAVVEYVSARPEFVTFPLPWSRTYVLLEGAEQGDTLAPAMRPLSLRESLARDAVRADARPAEPPFWWSARASCPTGSTSPGRHSSRVVYQRGDAVARGLAERIVALAGVTRGLRTAALPNDELAAALRADSERAYVLAIPSRSLAPCRDSGGWPEGSSVVPLIDTRAHAVVRRGTPPLTIEWDGIVRVKDAIDTPGSP